MSIDLDVWRKARLERSKARKAKLACKLESNKMLIAAMGYYLGRLTPSGLWVTLPWIKGPWKPYLRAACRILHVKVTRTRFRLPPCYRIFLERLGWVESPEPLNSDLRIDDGIVRFDKKDPQLLARVQSILRGEDFDPMLLPPLLRPEIDLHANQRKCDGYAAPTSERKKGKSGPTTESLQRFELPEILDYISERPLQELSACEVAQRQREELHARHRRLAQERTAHFQREDKKRVNLERRQDPLARFF